MSSVFSALQQLLGSQARHSHCLKLVMLPPGFPEGGWKKPVQGLGGGDVGSGPHAQAQNSASQASLRKGTTHDTRVAVSRWGPERRAGSPWLVYLVCHGSEKNRYQRAASGQIP